MKNRGGGNCGAYLECATQNPLQGQPLAPAEITARGQPLVFWDFKGGLLSLLKIKPFPGQPTQ